MKELATFPFKKEDLSSREEIKMLLLREQSTLKRIPEALTPGARGWRSQPAFSQPATALHCSAVKFKEQDVVLLQTCSSIGQTDKGATGLATSARHKRLACFLQTDCSSLGNWAYEEASLTPFDSDDRQSAHFLPSKPLAWCSRCSHPLQDTRMLCFIKLGLE